MVDAMNKTARAWVHGIQRCNRDRREISRFFPFLPARGWLGRVIWVKIIHFSQLFLDVIPIGDRHFWRIEHLLSKPMLKDGAALVKQGLQRDPAWDVAFQGNNGVSCALIWSAEI